MTRTERIKSLFFEALELPSETDPAAWTRQRCLGDPDLAAEVLSLLDCNREMKQATGFAAPVRAQPAVSRPLRFGCYETDRLLGRGGTGAVYQAHRVDGDFDYTVAVKVMNASLADNEFLRKFQTERQALAMLNHPHITRLLDGGITLDGDPYLVVEYVAGQTITRHCDANALSLEQRLRLFLQVCEAVEYAHQSLVLHRDLKPANILVTAEGSVKLLDFGAASLLERSRELTATRARMITPRYASPEQLRGERATTTTDVFSLGVILYELLTGAWPFGDPDSMVSELNRALRETSPKPPTTSVTEEAAKVRSASRGELARKLSGDLSAIAAKALESDPGKRYPSVRQFGEDVEAYLEGRPVRARPQTVMYRATKFLRRRWLTVAAATVFVIGLSTATLVAIRQAHSARAEAGKAKKVSNFLAEMMSSGTRAGKQETVAQLLDAFEPELQKNFKDDPETEALLRTNLGASYTTLEMPDRAAAQLEKAISLYHAAGSLKGEVVVLWILGQNAGALGDQDKAVQYYEQALDGVKRLGKNATPIWGFRIRRDLGYMLSITFGDRRSEGRALVEQAIELGTQNPSAIQAFPELMLAQARLGKMWALEGNDAAAMAAIEKARATRLRAGVPVEDTVDQDTLAMISARKQDFPAAREFARKSHEAWVQMSGRDHPSTLAQGLAWARYRAETGEIAEAVAQVRAGLPVIRRGPNGGSLYRCLDSASRVMTLAGLSPEAEQYARESLKLLDQLRWDALAFDRADSLEALGAALYGQKRYREAIPALASAEELYRRSGPAWAMCADRALDLNRQSQVFLKQR